MSAARDVEVPKSKTAHNTFVFPPRNKTTTETSESNFESGATKELSKILAARDVEVPKSKTAHNTFVFPPRNKTTTGTNDKFPTGTLGIVDSCDDYEESSNDDGNSVDESVEYEDDEDAACSIRIGGKCDKANVKPNRNDAELLNFAMNMPAQEICVSLRVYMLFVGFYLLPTSLTCRMML
jgi:hypothetical protein